MYMQACDFLNIQHIDVGYSHKTATIIHAVFSKAATGYDQCAIVVNGWYTAVQLKYRCDGNDCA